MTTRPLFFLAVTWLTACTSSQPATTPATRSAARPKTATAANTQTGTPAGTSGNGAGAGAGNTQGGSGVSADATGFPPTDLTPNCDPTKDFYQLDFPQAVKDCLSQNKMWNFDSGQCTTMYKATFDCTFASFASELTNLGLAAGPLNDQQAKGAKLIGCGASNDGTTLVAQFWFKNNSGGKADCTYSHQGSVTSACYKRFVTENTPASAPTDAAGSKAYVASCMTE